MISFSIDQEIVRVARVLEIDPDETPWLLWIADEAMSVDLPPGWDELLTEDCEWYYVNLKTKVGA